MREYKSFFKTVTAAEGDRCKYPTRLDTYGCGCLHDCSYCYAKSLLDFRGLWHPDDPSVADIKKIQRKLDKIPAGTILRLGGMTDCLQECEKDYRVTRQTIELLNDRRIGYLIVTKSDLILEYKDIMDKDLAHIQITVTSMDPHAWEKAVHPQKRIAAIKQLQEMGFDVAIRLSPLMDEYMDYDQLNSLGIEKAVVEFLRVNTWIKRWLPADLSKHTLKAGGYLHLPLEEKIKILEKIKIKSITVCEDVPEHYRYWQERVNPNRADCCNLEVKEG